MQADSSLVGADGGVELDAPATVHLDLALVVNPLDAELDGSLGFDDALKDLVLLVLRILIHERLKSVENLFDSLEVFGLIRKASLEFAQNLLGVGHGRVPFGE